LSTVDSSNYSAYISTVDKTESLAIITSIFGAQWPANRLPALTPVAIAIVSTINASFVLSQCTAQRDAVATAESPPQRAACEKAICGPIPVSYGSSIVQAEQRSIAAPIDSAVNLADASPIARANTASVESSVGAA